METKKIILKVRTPTLLKGGVSNKIIVTGISSWYPEIRDEATVELIADSTNEIIVVPDMQDTASVEEKRIFYKIWVKNMANFTQTVNIKSISKKGWTLNLLNSDYQPLPDNNGDRIPDFKDLAPFGGTDTLILEVVLPQEDPTIGNFSSGVIVDTIIIYGISTADKNVSDSSLLIITLKPGFNVHNYPNPFDKRTTFVWSQPEDGKINIVILDRAGRVVRNLINDSDYKIGINTFDWEGDNNNGTKVPPGLYFYIFTLKGKEKTWKAMNKIIFTGGE